jgi:phosphopantetheine--protein transferase-like protein
MILFPELRSPLLIVVQTDAVQPDEAVWLGSFLSAKETVKSQRFRFSHDRLSYIVVHGLLRWVLGRHMGISPDAVEISYNSFGKPYVSGYFPEIFFNLSHSSGLSVLAFDPGNEIGVDVERIEDDFEYDPIVQQFFTKEEGRYIQQVKAESRNRFYELWTRKEAFLKAVGTGITENLQTEVLKENIQDNTISEQGYIRKDFVFIQRMYGRNFRVTVAMSPHSGNLHEHIIGKFENGPSISKG